MTGDKRLTRVQGAHVASGQPLDGYEIHLGRSHGADLARPFAMVDGAPEGAVSADGRVTGTYLHGMFAGDAFRAAWLASLGGVASGASFDKTVEATLDALADHLEASLDVDGLLAAAR